MNNVNHPKHYTSHPARIECIDVVEHLPFCVGNAIKYLWRVGLKGDELEDLQKARWYVDREIKRRSKAKPRKKPKRKPKAKIVAYDTETAAIRADPAWLPDEIELAFLGADAEADKPLPRVATRPSKAK